MHVTLRIRRGLPRMRRGAEFHALRRAFARGCERPGFRLVHFSVQTDHVHLLVEGTERRSLSRGLQGLCVRMARALNRLWRRAGRVFAERYHEHVLRTPREVRHALVYVMQNARKHGSWRSVRALDPFASGPWFDGWRERPPGLLRLPRAVLAADARSSSCATAPVAAARTWLLRVGWMRHGRVGASEVPARA